MNRADFQRLAEIRLADAKNLLSAGQFDGAYYLAGYAVECALKACIAKQTQQHDFPPKDTNRSHYQHDLRVLLSTAELKIVVEAEISAKSALGQNWQTVLTWDEQKRYSFGIVQQQVEDFLQSLEDGQSGVITWLRQQW